MDDIKRVLYTDKYNPLNGIIEFDNYIMAKGGDGTLLRSINKFSHLNKPFFGKAAGSVNFLMNKDNAPSKKAKTLNFKRIKVKVTYMKTMAFHEKEEVTREFMASNDVMIGGDMNSWINFDVQEEDEIFGSFNGGGMIISTPQGSTGINKNNNGSVLPLSSSLWSITGDKTDHKIDYVIEPRDMIIIPTSRQSVTVWIDGSNHIIKDVTKIEICEGDKIQIIFNDYKSFQQKRRIQKMR